MDHSNYQDNKIMKKITLIIFLGLFSIFNVNAEIVCTSTTTAADIVADEDKSCTVDAEVMTVTLKKGEFYNATGGSAYGNDATKTWVLKTADQSGDIGGTSSINYVPQVTKSMNKPGTYTHFRGYLDKDIVVKGGFTTAGSPTLSCVTAGATSNVFGMSDTSCGDGTCITDVNDKAEVSISMTDLNPGQGSGNYLYDPGSGYVVELLQSDGETRATTSGNVDHLRAIIELSSPITVTENSIVSIDMVFKATNALAIEWNNSAADGCQSISNVAPVFTVTVTVTEP